MVDLARRQSSPGFTTTPTSTAVSSSSNAGTIAGSVVGGVVFLVLVVLAILLYLRARKRKRTPPSSEFMNSIRDGAAPVLRLDSGAEFTPEKGSVPVPFLQNSYYTSPPMQNMKFPDEMMMTDIPSGRQSVEQPLHPQRFSVQEGRKEELEIVPNKSSPVRYADSAPRLSLEPLRRPPEL